MKPITFKDLALGQPFHDPYCEEDFVKVSQDAAREAVPKGRSPLHAFEPDEIVEVEA